ncbi:Abi family protein [Bacillus toyonensis]|uniref:Abi family protein n=2 Tax=Bacillus cereus group TaxID=86661 RepID=UPI0015CF0A7B|nr:Abi family protein [Bacillus toyonensis]
MARYRTCRKPKNGRSKINSRRIHIMRRNRMVESNETSDSILKNAKLYGETVKDFLSMDRLIKELGKKLTFSDSEQITAKNFFRDINYYRFSIYPKLLPRRQDAKKYSFTDALNLYYFDEFLKSNLYEFTSYFENKWKGSLVNYLGNNYENEKFFMAQCYLDLNLYQSEEWAKKIILKIESRIKESNSLPIQHHRKYKSDYIPLWVLVEELTFGEFETFLTQINKSQLQGYIKSIYDHPTYHKAFSGWIASIRLLRNKISHHSRLYGANFTKPPQIFRADLPAFCPNIKSKPKLRNQLIACFYVFHKLFLFENTKIASQWNSFLMVLEEEIQRLDPILDVQNYLGFPVGWKELFTIR